MRNLFVKCIMAALIASTFVLLNCQKAGDRSLRGDKESKAADAALEVKNGVECPVGSASKQKTLKELKDKIAKIIASKAESITEAQKAELGKSLEEADVKTKEVITEIKQVKAEADGCFVTDVKTKKRSQTTSIAELTSSLEKMVVQAKEKAGVVTEQTAVAEEKEKERKAAALAKPYLQQGKEVVVSQELAEVMKSEAIDQGVFLMGGLLEINQESYKTQKANKNITICELTKVTDTEKVLKSSVTLKVLSVVLPNQVGQDERRVLTFTLSGEADLIYSFSCILKEGIKDEKESSVLAEVISAFGPHMKAKLASTTDVK